MAQDWPFPDIPSGIAIAVLEGLDANWPAPTSLTPTNVRLDGQNRAFLMAVTALQDAGWLMFESLLAGTGREPCVVDAVLTAKGRTELAVFRGAGRQAEPRGGE